MRHPDIDFLIAMERRRDELAEAERLRLYRKAQAALAENSLPQPRSRPRLSLRPLVFALAHSLSFLGDHLLTWSCRLQYRYQIANAAGNQPSPCR